MLKELRQLPSTVLSAIEANPSFFYAGLTGLFLLLALIGLIILIVLLSKRGRTARILFEQLETVTEKKAELEKSVSSLQSRLKTPPAPAAEQKTDKDASRQNKDLVFLTREYLIREFIALARSLAPDGFRLPSRQVILNATDEARVKGMLEQLEKIHALAADYGMIFPVEYYHARAAFHACRHEINRTREILLQGLAQYPKEHGFILSLAVVCPVLNRPMEAADLLDRYLESNPTDPEALRLLARLRLRTGELRKAEEACRLLTEAELKDSHRALLAWILFRQGFVSRAEEIAEELGKTESDEATDFTLGKLDEEKGLFREALIRFNRCQTRGYRDPELFRSLIFLNGLLGQDGQNRKLLENSGFDPAIDSLGLLLFVEKSNLSWNEMGLYKDLCEHLCACREIDPLACTALASVLLRFNESDKAKEQLEKAVSLDPACLPALTRLGRFHLDRNNPAETLACLEKGLSVAPADPDLLTLKSEHLARTGKPEEAAQIASSLVEQSPHNAVFLERIGRLYLKLNDFREALHHFQKIADCGFRNPALFNLTGSAFFGLKDYEEALKAWRRALEMDGRNLEALNNIGVVHCIRKEWKQAKKSFSRALQTDPACSQTHYNLARLYTALNRENAARHDARFRDLTREERD